MNRRQKRAHRRIFEGTPGGHFRGELQARADQAAYQEQLRKQMGEEERGAPIDPEIAAGMTKPKIEEPLYQVVAIDRETRRLTPVFPAVIKSVAEEFLVAMNAMIAAGRDKNYVGPIVVPVTPMQGAT